MKIMTLFISSTILFLSLESQAVGYSISCLGHHEKLGNFKIEADSKELHLYKISGASVGKEPFRSYDIELGNSMIGEIYFTSFVDNCQNCFNFQLTVAPARISGAYEPLDFYDAPYLQAEMLYLDKGEYVTWGQKHNDTKVIESYSFLTCRDNNYISNRSE